MKTLSKIFYSMTLALITSAFFATTAWAEIISVTVKDSKTKESVEFATVELLNEKDSVIAGGITDAKGFINLPGTVNSGKIRIQFLGYKTFETPVTNKDLGTVFLEEDEKELAEVTVTGQTRTTKIDRDVTVITKELKAGTATARELLGKLNGVQYNPYDQSITVNGKSNILILVDGIEKDQNMAKTLSPDRIARVEVIKDPVGKYAADGYSAVINIITRKDYSGFDININTNPMFNFITPRGNNTFIQEGTNVNILYTYKKLNLYATGYNWAGKLRIPIVSERRYGDLSVMTPPMDYKNPNMNTSFGNNNFSIGGDYTLKPENTIALEINYNGNTQKANLLSDLTTSLNNVPVSESQFTNNTRNTGDALQATLTYHGKWGEKSRFEGDLRYRHSTPANYSDYTQGAMHSDSYNTQAENFYRLNLDYTYQFSPKFSAEIAYGAIIDNFNLYQNNQTLKQRQARNRPSFYLTYSPAKQWSIKAGAMVEFYSQTFMELKQSQTGFLPYVNIMYKPSDKFSVIAKYQATPNYPDINSLSPFTVQTDSLTWSMGNPNLQASNYKVVSLDINFLRFFNVQPFFDFDSRNSQQYLYEENGQYYQSPVNANFKKLGVNVNFRIPFKKYFFWQNFLQMSNAWISYNDASNKQLSCIFTSMLLYNQPKWDAAAGIGIQKMITKWGTLQGYNGGGNDIPLMMIQKNLFKKRLSLTLIYVPPIKEGFLRYSQDSMTKTPNYYAFNSAGLKLLNNLMILQINYHFNSGKQINVKKSSLDNDNNVKQKSGGIGL